MARASISQTVQIGVEATHGTAVAANRKLQSLSIEPSINPETDQFRPMGQKWPSLVTLNREWVTANLSGAPTYDEIVYPLSSVLEEATVTQPDATNAPSVRLWTFTPSSTDIDTFRTFTVEQGDSTRAHRFAFGAVTEFGLDISRGGIDLSGSMIGTALQDGVTLTAGPTTLPLVPVLPSQVSVYMDNTAAGLGTTKLAAGGGPAFSANVNIGDRRGPVWPIDAALDSFGQTVETEPSGSLELTLEADATAMGLLTTLRNGDTKFVRIEAVGNIIATTFPYRLTIDLALKVSDIGDFDDEDGVFVVPPTLQLVHDATWGRALQVEVQNTTSAL